MKIENFIRAKEIQERISGLNPFITAWNEGKRHHDEYFYRLMVNITGVYKDEPIPDNYKELMKGMIIKVQENIIDKMTKEVASLEGEFGNL